MKSITSFLNTDGGTLFVGVLDNGDISGIEEDAFKDTDNFYRHFSNLVKDRIGPEHLPYIKTKVVPIENKTILKVDCNSSDKEVFLKTDKLEEFYVRAGASSVKLTGSKLIDYVNQKFEKN
jgi:predicted HTH transcriptional regulator